MKKNKIYLLSLLLLIGACKKDTPIDQLTTVELETERKEVADVPDIPHSIPIPPGGIEIPMPAYKSATDSKNFFEQNKTSPNAINYAKLKTIYLRFLSPDTANFNCMDKVKIYISANGYQEVLVAEKNDIPKGIKSLETIPVDVDLKNYFIQDTIIFRVVPHFVDYPASGGQLEMGATFKISVTGSKA